MYEEEDEDLPRHLRNFTNHLQSGSADFNTRLANYVLVHFGGIEAASEALKKTELERQQAEAQGHPMNNSHINNFFPPQFQGNTMGLQQQMAIQQSQLFGHPMPQQYMQQSMAPNMMHMNNQRQITYPHSPYGMQSQQQMQQMNQQIQQQFTPQPQQFNPNMNQQMQQHVQPLQLTNGSGSLQIPLRVRSGSARSNHSNSPLPPAQSPIILTPAHSNNERSGSLSAATPIPSIEQDNGHAMPNMARNNNKQRNSVVSNNSNSSGNGNGQNEYLSQGDNVDNLLGLQPDYNYSVGADIFATATPGPHQGGNGYFEPHHFSSGFNVDPLHAMFQIGSGGESTPLGNDLHNAYAANGCYGIKQETPNAQVNIQPKHMNVASGQANHYLQGMDAAANLKSEQDPPEWNDWTEGGDYESIGSQQEV